VGRKRDTPRRGGSEDVIVDNLENTERLLRAVSPGDVKEFSKWANKILKKDGVWPSRYQAESFAKARNLSQLWGRQQFEALDQKFRRRRQKKTKRV
jgi:hypothetical protein